jgi:hypothetical protein
MGQRGSKEMAVIETNLDVTDVPVADLHNESLVWDGEHYWCVLLGWGTRSARTSSAAP